MKSLAKAYLYRNDITSSCNNRILICIVSTWFFLRSRVFRAWMRFLSRLRIWYIQVSSFKIEDTNVMMDSYHFCSLSESLFFILGMSIVQFGSFGYFKLDINIAEVLYPLYYPESDIDVRYWKSFHCIKALIRHRRIQLEGLDFNPAVLKYKCSLF